MSALSSRCIYLLNVVHDWLCSYCSCRLGACDSVLKRRLLLPAQANAQMQSGRLIMGSPVTDIACLKTAQSGNNHPPYRSWHDARPIHASHPLLASTPLLLTAILNISTISCVRFSTKTEHKTGNHTFLSFKVN